MAVQILQDQDRSVVKVALLHVNRGLGTQNRRCFWRESFGVLKLCEKQTKKKKNHLHANQFGV